MRASLTLTPIMSDRKTHSRRRVLKGMASIGVLATAGKVVAAPSTTTAATTRASTTSIEDIAAMERVLGREFNDAERKLMADSLSTHRARERSLRARTIPPDIEPAIHFDPRVPPTNYPSGPSTYTLSQDDMPAYDGDPASLAFATVPQLSRLIQARKITCVQLTQMYLSRLKEIGPRLNCVINLTEDLAMSQAKRADDELAAGKSRGPLHGIPWGAKDLLATKGIPTTWGAMPYVDQIFDYDATVVRKLYEAGAVLCAKLSLGELAMGDVWFKGRTRTPWNPKNGSSGSSAGPCAAVAAGLVTFAIGSETMGSIISPCMTNATTGLRPTYGRVSRYGAMPLSRTMDKLGPIARGVEDCALVLSAIHGPDPLDMTAADVPFQWNPSSDLKSLRVGYHQAAFEEMKKNKDAKRAKIYADALDHFREIAGDLVPIKLPDSKNYTGLSGLIISAESASSFSELVTSGKVRDLKQQDEGSWPNTFRSGAFIPASDYLRAMQVRTMLQREMVDVFKDIDLFVNIPYSGASLSYTNTTGHPSLITRCGILDKKPVMIELIGNLYREDAICRLGFAYEKSTDWNTLWPDTTKIPQLST